MGAVVEQDRAGVVELVGERDAQLVGLLVRDRVDVGRLRSYQGGLGSTSVSELAATMRAASAPNSLADALEHRRPAAVLDGVVEQRADRLGLAAAHLEHERGDGQQVRDVGDLGALAQLAAVVLGREQQGAIEGVAEQWRSV